MLKDYEECWTIKKNSETCEKNVKEWCWMMMNDCQWSWEIIKNKRLWWCCIMTNYKE